jgi:hypothetical protein
MRPKRRSTRCDGERHRHFGLWTEKPPPFLGAPVFEHDQRKPKSMSLGTILLVILVIALLGGFSGLGGGHFYGTGYYGGGGLGLILVIVLVLVLVGKI